MSSIIGDPAIDGALNTDLTIDITTIGRKSGEPRRIEIWFLHIGGRIFITGTPGPRDWFANLVADNRLTFHLKESIVADLEATANVVDDVDTRRMIFEHDIAHWYRGQTSVDNLVGHAPVVEIVFGEQPKSS